MVTLGFCLLVFNRREKEQEVKDGLDDVCALERRVDLKDGLGQLEVTCKHLVSRLRVAIFVGWPLAEGSDAPVEEGIRREGAIF